MKNKTLFLSLSLSVGAQQKSTHRKVSVWEAFVEGKQEKLSDDGSEMSGKISFFFDVFLLFSLLLFSCVQTKQHQFFHGSNCCEHIIYVEVKKLSK
jgi:hypothetical protein